MDTGNLNHLVFVYSACNIVNGLRWIQAAHEEGILVVEC